ncbi:MAG TPA: DUF6457 domain-containing protein [Acidimicrobiales bacterium]|nr:DUF6457 domain-containing protein [Acidimicrobiales bacterium]
MALDTRGWLDRYAAALGLPPVSDDDIEALLTLSGVAAHASERTAAPISCYLVARSGVPIVEALAAARRLADEPGSLGGPGEAP